jgi:carbon storage regulator
MLVFTRKRHEAIMIGEGIEVRVLRVGRDGVRLGVSAPASVSVHRREIYEQIREENKVAAVAVPSVEDLAGRLRRAISAEVPQDEAIATPSLAKAVRR